MSVSEELARLAKLRDDGVLTQEQFEQQRDKVLANGAAPSAPAAAAPPGKGSKAAIGCGVVAVILIVLVIIGALASPTTDTGEAAKAPETAATPPTEVTAIQLFRAYQANEAAAQQQYGDRPLLVTGTVAGVDLDFMDDPVVQLRTDNQFMNAQANLVEADHGRAAELQQGRSVQLLCAGVGEVIGTPVLRDCAIQ